MQKKQTEFQLVKHLVEELSKGQTATFQGDLGQTYEVYGVLNIGDNKPYTYCVSCTNEDGSFAYSVANNSFANILKFILSDGCIDELNIPQTQSK